MFDLRSDTITQPTESMRAAMAKAEVGDDVYSEDPTVNRLQELAAEKTGKEAALFVPSGTMGNLIAILSHTHTARCGEVICEESSHVRLNEAGGMAALGGLMCCPVKGRRGALDPEDVRANIRVVDVHHPSTALICLENTHNFAGGAVVPLENMAAIRDLAHEYGLPVHLDGARAFNAAAALNRPVSDIAQYADSANLCLSKGLSAPVGSVLTGSSAFIERAKHYRKLLGGGMRQAGVLAAAGIIALTEMAERLFEDNENAHALAVGLAGMKGLSIDPRFVQTNIVIFDVSKTGMTATEFAKKLKGFGVLASTTGPYSVRFVTHRHISAADIPLILKAVHRMLTTA
ncbi:MAG: GntG family PLP-dependent aldolase [Christensenellales bacterium]|jgi:threonine aldolase